MGLCRIEVCYYSSFTLMAGWLGRDVEELTKSTRLLSSGAGEGVLGRGEREVRCCGDGGGGDA